MEIDFYSKQQQKSLSEPLFWGLWDNVHTPSIANDIGKRVVDFILVVIELCRYLLWLRRFKRKSVKVGVFEGGGSL